MAPSRSPFKNPASCQCDSGQTGSQAGCGRCSLPNSAVRSTWDTDAQPQLEDSGTQAEALTRQPPAMDVLPPKPCEEDRMPQAVTREPPRAQRQHFPEEDPVTSGLCRQPLPSHFPARGPPATAHLRLLPQDAPLCGGDGSRTSLSTRHKARCRPH